MKLFIDCRMIKSGGIGSYLKSLLPFFVENYQCTLLGDADLLKEYLNFKSVKIIDCNIKSFSLKELFFFPKAILAEINKCDIYYTPYCNIPCRIKIPIYSTIHDVVFLDVKELAGKIGTIIRKWFYQRAINRSKAVFTVSNFSKERIEHHLKTLNTPVIVTYNAVPQWFCKNDSKIVAKSDMILFTGNIKKHKGLDILLPAFQKALSKGLNAKLFIVGNAENFRTEDSSIFEKINAMPKDSVEFTGRISDEKLNQYYSKAKLLVQPSLYEGFGMPPMEALSLGTNVVLSDIPVFKEIYKDFPVTYFKAGNSDDLCKKIIESFNKPSPKIKNNRYSFEKTFEIIKGALK